MKVAAAPLKSDTDLGCIEQLIGYTGMKRTYLQALKIVAAERDSDRNPSCWVGTKSTKKWILAWLRRNRDFRVTLAYPAKKKPETAEAH